MADKTVYLVAGPNGAGKTTFTENFLKKYVTCDEFLNADLIAAGLSPFAPERQARAASEIFLKRLLELEQGQNSFALETTLSGRNYQRRIVLWKEAGFRVSLIFLWLPDSDFAVNRVAERVRHGGHHIPETVIRRRYLRGLQNLLHIYLPLVDQTSVLDASEMPFRPVWFQSTDREICEDEKIWSRIRKTGVRQT